MTRAQLFIKTIGHRNGDVPPIKVEIVRDDKVPEYIRFKLSDGSGNRAVIIEASNGYQECWTREWKEVTL